MSDVIITTRVYTFTKTFLNYPYGSNSTCNNGRILCTLILSNNLSFTIFFQSLLKDFHTVAQIYLIMFLLFYILKKGVFARKNILYLYYKAKTSLWIKVTAKVYAFLQSFNYNTFKPRTILLCWKGGNNYVQIHYILKLYLKLLIFCDF